ncbi:MAG: FAD:protein FMN transferase [Ignavibacteria bacterium]
MKVLFAYQTRSTSLPNNQQFIIPSKTKRIKFINLIFAAFIILSSHISISQESKLYEFSASKYLMGTEFEITAVHTSIDSMKKAVYYSMLEVERIQGVMSMQIGTSEISKINSMAGISPVKVSYETYSIIERSIEYSKKYEGVFDITIGPITIQWGFNGDRPVTEIPTQNTIDSLLKQVGYESIRLNSADTSVYLELKGMMIDLGGIAKGYAVDRASEMMKSKGINSFIVNGGGDMYISGYKNISQNQKWSIGIKHPRLDNSVLAVFEINDMAVGTSGDYERYAIINGKRYHHIFDPKTGWPSNKSESTTSIAPTTEEAVILSKYYFIQGFSVFTESREFEGVVVDSTGEIHTSQNMSLYNIKLSK